MLTNWIAGSTSECPPTVDRLVGALRSLQMNSFADAILALERDGAIGTAETPISSQSAIHSNSRLISPELLSRRFNPERERGNGTAYVPSQLDPLTPTYSMPSSCGPAAAATSFGNSQSSLKTVPLYGMPSSYGRAAAATSFINSLSSWKNMPTYGTPSACGPAAAKSFSNSQSTFTTVDGLNLFRVNGRYVGSELTSTRAMIGEKQEHGIEAENGRGLVQVTTQQFIDTDGIKKCFTTATFAGQYDEMVSDVEPGQALIDILRKVGAWS